MPYNLTSFGFMVTRLSLDFLSDSLFRKVSSITWHTRGTSRCHSVRMLKLSKLSAGLRFVWKYAVHFLSVWWVICSNILTFCRKESIYSCRFLGTTGGGRREVSIGNLGLWPNIISKGDSWVDWLARVVLYAYVTWPCGGSCILTKGSVLTHWRNNSLVNWRNFIEETWKESVKQLWKLLKDGTAGMLYRSSMQITWNNIQNITYKPISLYMNWYHYIQIKIITC